MAEWCYDVHRQGKFIFYIQDLHKQYEPIVRITPDEIHILDSDFWETIYTKAGRVDKYDYMSVRFGNDTSVFTTAPDSLHRVRCAALTPFFSRQRIIDLQSSIHEKLDLLAKKVMEYKKNHVPMTSNRGYMAFAEDVIMQYCFARDYNALDTPDWTPILHDPLQAVAIIGMHPFNFHGFPSF